MPLIILRTRLKLIYTQFKIKCITLCLLLWCVLNLTACISVPEILSLNPSNQSKLYTGKFSVNYLNNGTISREQGNFEWKIIDPLANEPTHMQLSLLSPFNTTIALITLNPQLPTSQRASLKTPKQTFYESNLSQLMNKVLGWQLPLEELALSLYHNDFKSKPYIPNDWNIEILSQYESNNQPKLIVAKNNSKEISARILLNDIENNTLNK